MSTGPVGAATKGQQYEYLLFGSVTDGNVSTLLHRLRGLCDYASSGGTPFTDKEIVLKSGGWAGSTRC